MAFSLFFYKQLIKHYASATFIDVLHSPFVFELYNDCIARKPYPEDLSIVNDVWKKALRNQTLVEQVDFGTQKQSRKKPVSYFAKFHAKPKRIAQILYLLERKYQYTHCLELGTSLGYSTMHLAKALPPLSNFTTIEGAAELVKVATTHFVEAGVSNKVKTEVGPFDDVLPGLIERYPTIDLAFVDGNHSYQATIDYFNLLLAKKNNNSVFIFDDIYWSEGMTKAWEEIKNHPDVTVTVDLFFIGLVYFRKEQRKEHFKLRVF